MALMDGGFPDDTIKKYKIKSIADRLNYISIRKYGPYINLSIWKDTYALYHYECFRFRKRRTLERKWRNPPENKQLIKHIPKKESVFSKLKSILKYIKT